MITSNNINVRNLFLTKELFNKTITASEGFVLPNGGAVIEVVLSVTTADSTSYVTVIKQGESQSSAINPIIYDDNFNQVNTRRIYLNKTGLITFYVDAKTFNTSLVVTKGSGTPVLSARIGVYNDKSILSENIIKEKSLATIGFNTSENVDDAINNFIVKGYRYAIFDCSILSGANFSSSISVNGYNNQGSSSLLELIDVRTLQSYKSSTSTNAVVLNENKNYRFFVDLGKSNINLIQINRNIVGNIVGSVSLVKLTNEDLYNVDVSSSNNSTNDVLFEDDKIIAEKIGNVSDAWNNQIVSFEGSNIYWTDEISNLRKKTFNVQSVITAELSGIKSVYLLPYDTDMVNTSKKTRIAFIITTGVMYVNYFNGGGESDFGKAKIWECVDTNRRILTNDANLISNPLYKYDNTLTATHYTRNETKVVNSKTFIQYQGQMVMQWLGHLCRTKKMVSFGTYHSDSRRIGFYTTTDGGENWVQNYDFINTTTPSVYNSLINTSSFADYSGGLSLFKIGVTSPTETIKEPTEIYSYTSIAFQSITKGNTTIINSTSHGLVNGNLILFKGNAQDNNWSSIVCDENTPTKIVQNIYSVYVIDANSFELREYLGSYDFPLICRHIHSVNEVVDGVVISTGELHPNGWMILFKQGGKDGSTVVNSFTFPKNNTFRFNSSAKSLQRACGFIYNNDKDPLIIFGSDEALKNIGQKTIIEGRTQNLNRNPVGIWKGRMSKIDDWENFECKLDIGESCIWLYRHSNYILAYFQSGANAISYDYGENWSVFQNGTQLSNGVYRNNLIIGNGYMIKHK